MIRNIFTKKGSAKAAMLLTGLVVLVAAALIVLSFANTAFTRGSMQAGEKVALIKGEVVAIDTVRHLTVLTVQSGEIGQFPNDQMHIYLNPNTMVKICKATEPAKDIKVDYNATIKYHELGGLAVANSASERC